MKTLRRNSCFGKGSYRNFLGVLLLVLTIISIISCSKTTNVYYPPSLDLAPYGRLGVITFSDNANPSVAQYATEQFQSHIQSAQIGSPIVELGTKEQILKSVGSNQLDIETLRKIGQRYKVSAVFNGTVIYSDVKTNVDLNAITDFTASVNSTLYADLSVKLIETKGGATVWSDLASWKRKLSRVNVNKNTGISIGTKGYDDAYRKLVPDMVNDVTSCFRGRYVKERVKS